MSNASEPAGGQGRAERAGSTALAAAEAALRRFAWDDARTLLLESIAGHETAEALELLTRACGSPGPDAPGWRRQ